MFQFNMIYMLYFNFILVTIFSFPFSLFCSGGQVGSAGGLPVQGLRNGQSMRQNCVFFKDPVFLLLPAFVSSIVFC